MSSRITVAIPLYNEVASLPELLHEVDAALDAVPHADHEILCVNDGSNDGTLEKLLELREIHKRLRVVSLSRNFGHQAALTAALESAVGDAVFVIDGDLQDDPGVLPRFLSELEDGADVVYATRRDRPDGFIRRIGYLFHYRLLSAVSETPVQVDSGDFALLTRRAVDILNSLPERQRYLRGMRSWIGLKQIGVGVKRGERTTGASKYRLRDLAALSFDGLLAFSRVPLRIATVVGLITILGGIAYAVYVVISRLSGAPPQGFATLALLQIGFSGVTLLVLGVIGEYVGRIYDEVKRRPVYVIDQEWPKGGFDNG